MKNEIQPLTIDAIGVNVVQHFFECLWQCIGYCNFKHWRLFNNICCVVLPLQVFIYAITSEPVTIRNEMLFFNLIRKFCVNEIVQNSVSQNR